MTDHAMRVAEVAAQIKARASSSGHASIEKSAVSHFVPNPRDPKHRDRKVSIRDLNHILELDIANRRCVAEPGVTFTSLVRKTLPWGLLPKLVPELKTITLGGAIAGCSVESMSYKYGGFHDSCRSYELITGKGEVLRCSREENALVFEMIHGSYGTLGVLTQLEFELIPAKQHVRMDYCHYGTFDEFHEQLLAACKTGRADFIDAIVHARDHFVICLGTFVDSVPHVSSYDRLSIFYKSTCVRDIDYLTTYDYLFRYDAECHWLSRTLPVPGMERLPMRLLLGGTLLGSTNVLTWSKRLEPILKYHEDPHVVVDVFIPDNNLSAFFGWYENVVDFYPLWVVPYRAPGPYAWVHPQQALRNQSEFYIDCAIYGKRNTPEVDYHKLLEDKTFELGGLKTLISRNSYDRETFWSIYHKENYDRVKERTDPGNLFRNLYDKFHPHATSLPSPRPTRS